MFISFKFDILNVKINNDRMAAQIFYARTDGTKYFAGISVPPPCINTCQYENRIRRQEMIYNDSLLCFAISKYLPK